MKKSIASLLFLISFLGFSQEKSPKVIEIKGDSIIYQKTTDLDTERTFSSNLNNIYSGKDFEYKEETTPKKEEPANTEFVEMFIFFMSKVFPFLLGIFIILIILKAFLGFDARFWKTTKKGKLNTKKLVYEDEDIHDIDLESLLQNAIDNKDFRLAIRYYYLSTLKILSSNKLIDYHKDKTNSEYLFELENKEMRTQFSYLSYVYSYVWYGEFPVNENNFKVAENKYQNFLKTII